MFSEEWESIYSKGLQNSIWPWSDLVSRVMRTAKDERLNLESVNVLELGCGAGANVAFFGALESRYHGIDGSASTIVGLQNRFKENKKIKFSKMDFTKELPDECFNLFIDRSSVTHNTTDAIRNTLALCGKKAEKGAIFLGFDWFSTLHSDYAFGKTLGDKYTKTDFDRGQFKGVGVVHFSDKEHLVELFHNIGWKLETMELKIIENILPESGKIGAGFSISARWLG